VVPVGDTDAPTFSAFMEYIYSDHAPIEDGDALGLLLLCNRYNAPRLLSMCELYVSKMVEVATKDGIEKADIDLIGLLHLAQQNNANQLAAFCLHFISNNYQPMKKRSEWSSLAGENLKYIEEHQWPPVSYLKQLEEYESKMKASGAGNKENCSVM